MKHSPTLTEQLKYALGELYTLDKLIIENDDLVSFDETHLEQCHFATKVRHRSNIRLSRTVPEKSALLLYELLHGNLSKRKQRSVSLIVFLMFLYTHGYWLRLPPHELKSLILWIEMSPMLAQKETIEGARKIILSQLEMIDI